MYYRLVARFLNAFNNRFTWRTVTPSSVAASACVMTRFFAFRNVTNRSFSAWLISSSPSCTHPASACQEDISTLLHGVTFLTCCNSKKPPAILSSVAPQV